MKLCCSKCGDRVESRKKDNIIFFKCLNCGKVKPIFVSNNTKKLMMKDYLIKQGKD